MKHTLFLLSILALLLSCEQDEAPEENPIVYPVTYTIADYTLAEADYFVLGENNTTSPVDPSAGFAAHLDYLKTDELPEYYQEFAIIYSVGLLSDSIVNVVFKDFQDETYDTTQVTYQRIDDNIILNLDGFDWSFTSNQTNSQLTDCSIVFTNTSIDFLTGSVEYTGFDITPCTLYPDGNYLPDYLDQLTPGYLKLNDTLAVAKISYYFDK